MRERLNSLPLGEIRITDRFWQKYIGLVKNVIIPYQWGILNDKIEGTETSHCLANFRIAAGEAEGEFQGAVFQDTDVAKWLEAVGYVLSAERDEELEKIADETIDLIGRAQCEDGYLNTYFTIKDPGGRWKNLREGHELYTAGHMIEAAVAYYEATGKKKFIEIVCRLADLIVKTFGPGADQIQGYPGHQEIELALVKLYHVTGKGEYLELARYFIEIRGVGENYFLKEAENEGYRQIFPEFAGYDPRYSQSHLPVRDQKTAEGHAVRAVYMYCAMADLAYEYQDEALLETCTTLWKNMTGRRMYITGGIGSSGLLERFTADYDLPNDCNYSETCASIGLALYGKRLSQILEDASYVDIMELALYNTVLDGIAMDGKSFFYVNPLEVCPDNCIDRTYREHVKPVRQKWFGVACCPPNIARTLASLGQYVYSAGSDTLYMNLYLSNDTRTRIGSTGVHIKTETGYPFEGGVEIQAEAEQEGVYLALRLPGYVKKYSLVIDGSPLKVTEEDVKNGYIRLPLKKGSSKILWNMELPVRRVRANPRVRADVGKVALMKGPVVYCLEETDNGSGLQDIFLDSSAPIEEVYREDLLQGTLVLKAEAKRMDDSRWEENQLYGEEKPVWQSCTVTAVPYCYWCNRTPGEMLVWINELNLSDSE